MPFASVLSASLYVRMFAYLHVLCPCMVPVSEINGWMSEWISWTVYNQRASLYSCQQFAKCVLLYARVTTSFSPVKCTAMQYSCYYSVIVQFVSTTVSRDWMMSASNNMAEIVMARPEAAGSRLPAHPPWFLRPFPAGSSILRQQWAVYSVGR